MSKLTTPKVSLIIAVYKQANYLERILYSLKNQTFQDFEIVISDDGSGDDIAQIIRNFQNQFLYPINRVWHEDAGFRKTIIANKAVKASKSEYLVFIDGDCLLHHKFIERHFKRRELGVVLSGRRIMLDEEISKTVSNQDVITNKFEQKSFWWNNSEPKERKRGYYFPFIYSLINLGKNYWAFGSNFSLHKSDFYAVNGYDESINGRGFEDINLSTRFTLKGFKTKRLTYEALQYHLFHTSGAYREADPEIIYPKNFYAKIGIND